MSAHRRRHTPAPIAPYDAIGKELESIVKELNEVLAA